MRRDTLALADVLNALPSQRDVLDWQFSLDLVVDRSGNTDASTLCEPFQASRNIDSISVNPFPFYDYVANVQPDATFHSPVGRKLRISEFKLLLNLYRTSELCHTLSSGESTMRP